MSKLQLFCITYAGGNASFFQNLIQNLNDEIECHALEYSGHGIRRKEPFYENFEALLQDVAQQIYEKRNPQADYLILGYSMGSYVTYELVTKYLKKDLPKHVFLAAHEPPHLPFRGKEYATLNDQDFVEAMRTFGGMDERMIQNQRFLNIYLTPVRMDYQYLHEYKWDESHEKMPCDITVFYSPEDTKSEDMRQWERHTTGRMKLIAYHGNHFFLKEHVDEIAEEICKVI